MAVPTISGVTPNVGPTMGRTMFEITGTNFRLPPTPPPGPTTGETQQTVEVLFGAEEAISVKVVSETIVRAVNRAIDPGTYSITVRNLDDAGVVIPGETVTLADAVTFKRPVLRPEANAAGEVLRMNQSELTRVVRTFLRDLKRQILDNVSLTTHTDYFDPETGLAVGTVNLSRLPGLVLIGPDLVENRQYSLNDEPDFDEGTPDDDFVTTRVPYTVDIQFEILGMSNNTAEMLNLMQAATMYFESNKFLRLQKDGADPTKGFVEYEMDFQPGEQFKASRTVANASNLRQFSGLVEIRGFDLDQLAGINSGDTNGIPLHEVVDRSREQDDVDVQLDPAVQVAITSATPGPGEQPASPTLSTSVITTSGPVVSSIKLDLPPKPCRCGD